MAGNFSRQELLEREILEIADRERERLGRELHDGLCQSLAGIAALASALAKSLAAKAEAGPAAAADEIAGLLREAVGEARGLARGLAPIDPSKADLHGLLQKLADEISRSHRISCSFACDRGGPELHRDTEAQLLRIAQEAVHNAIAHGRADHIEISLESIGAAGLLSIRDNGVGLPEDYRDRGGIGLQTMNYRARAIGGFLTLAGRPHGGTVVACAFRPPAARQLRKGAEHARCPN